MPVKKDPVLIAVTGGPGVGKTSMLQELERQGYTVVPEVARSIIAERKANGLSPRPDPLAFAQAIFDRDVQQYSSTSAGEGLIFFDRSVLDSLSMLAQLNRTAASEVRPLLEKYHYHPTAIILPPWRGIYRVDSERDQSYEEAVRVYENLRQWYIECGYTLFELPPGSVDERCEFVLQVFGERPDDA